MRRLSLAALIALLVVGLPAAAAVTLYRAWASGTNGIADEPPLAKERMAGVAGRCSHCGRIERARKLRPDAAGPLSLPGYEYTVRMADGSSRVFREPSPARWRVGARLIYIDGVQRPQAPVMAGIRD